MSWFAVKTLYRSVPTGKPRGRDEKYRPGIASLEERIVLFRARNADSAIRKALTEAKKYVKQNDTTNVYGQRVESVIFDLVESFELSDEPGDGAEIFSQIRLIPARMKEAAVINQLVGESPGPDTSPMFIAGFLADALRDEGADI